MKNVVEGTFDSSKDFDTYDIDNSKLITVSSNNTQNILINLIVADSNLENSTFLKFSFYG